MRRKRPRAKKSAIPDLVSNWESRKQKAERVEKVGNYATRTVRKWIRSDPFTIEACQAMAADTRRIRVNNSHPQSQCDALRISELTRRVSAWFHTAVREEEPSAAYADFLTGSIDVEWGILAEELLADVWGEGP